MSSTMNIAPFLSPKAPGRHRAGFTLIESLSVVLVLATVIAIAAPSILDVVRASRLSSAGDILAGKMVEAQGLALTFSSDVELRIYNAGVSVQGAAGADAGQFVQLLQWTEHEPGETAESTEEVTADYARLKKIGERMSLPEGIAISENTELTSAWKLETATDTDLPDGRKYVAIRFRPDGSTDLPETGQWFLTLLEQRDAQATRPPANFYTLEIDPVTAKLQVYRPE